MAVAGSWALPGSARADTGEATVSLGRLEKRAAKRPDFNGYVYHNRTAHFRLGDTLYAIAYKIAVGEQDPTSLRPVEGYIGMPAPSSCNWYHSGFLTISLDGKDIGSTPLSSMLVAEDGPRAILDLVWHHEAASVRARFMGLPDSDHLLCQLTVDPKRKLSTIGVSLRCYPSYFTSWNNRDGARRIRTPSRLVAEGSSATAALAENWWAVYYDEVFDVAQGEGEGPCAMMAAPIEGAKITFAPGGYAVDTRIEFPGDTREMRFAFWEFPGVPNAQALARLRTDAAAMRAQLSSAPFTPAPVSGLDVAALRAEVRRALDSPAAREYLGPKLQDVQAWLADCELTPTGSLAASGIAAQEQLLRSVDEYYEFIWEVKLAELLDSI